MAKVEATPELRARAKKLHDAGKKYKEIAAELKLDSEKVAWHLVNTIPKGGGKKAPGKAPGKAPRTPKAPSRPTTRPKAPKASGASKASPRASKKASAKAPKASKAPTGDTERAQAEEATTASDTGKRLNLLAPNGGDRPVAHPPAFRPVPKPGDRKSK